MHMPASGRPDMPLSALLYADRGARVTRHGPGVYAVSPPKASAAGWSEYATRSARRRS